MIQNYSKSSFLMSENKFYEMKWTRKCVNDKAPPYLQKLNVRYSPARKLHSSNKFVLTVPQTISSYGDCSFSACAPKLWNSFRINICETTSLEQLKKLLKTYLFNCAYDSLWSWFYIIHLLYHYVSTCLWLFYVIIYVFMCYSALEYVFHR